MRLQRELLGNYITGAGNELRYGVRLVDLEANPLSEALLLWADVPSAAQ